MKFAILSDTHDNIINFNKVINWLNQEQIDTILHCGDICKQETINETTKKFKGKIHFVRGNGDFGLDGIPETMEIKLGGKRIFINHYPDIAKKMAESGKYDLVFYGHTHKPWLDRRSLGEGGKEKTCLLINPGEVAGQHYKPTFALYDTVTEELELKILEKM